MVAGMSNSMNQLAKALALPLPLLLALGSCDEAPKKGAETGSQVVLAWQSAKLGEIDLKKSEDTKTYAGGSCLVGTVAKLQVELCEFKDALAADSAKEAGIETIGSSTGAALVRDRYLLVVADVDKVDVHGKTLNQVAKIFLAPPELTGF
jgi:hypothetical protein